MSIQALREQRAAKAKAVDELVKKTDWNAEVDQPIYDVAMKEIDDIDARMKRIHDSNEMLARAAVDGIAAEAMDKVAKDSRSISAQLYAKWIRGGDRALSNEEWTAIRNTTSTTTPAEGGYTVQTDIATRLLDAMKYYGAMRQVATILPTDKGNPLSFPTSDGTTEVGEWIPENTTATALDPSFGTKALPVWKASSKVVAIPFELMQDSQVDIEAFVNKRLSDRLGRITNTGYTIGNGTAQPTGVMAAATTGVTAANATSQVTSVTYDSLVGLVHSVDKSYRMGPCKFMMNDLSIRQIRLIKDSQGRPIFVPGWESTVPGASGAAPDVLLGYPLITNNDIVQMGVSAKSIAFGDFSYYYIRDAMSMSMFRFTDSAYTKLGQVGFLAWMRTGGNLIDVGGAIKLFVNAAS